MAERTSEGSGDQAAGSPQAAVIDPEAGRLRLWQGECRDILTQQAKVDLVFTSPPYEDARQYGIDFKLKGQEWVDWAAERFRACVGACSGLVCWVVAGRTKNRQWSATPALLMADLVRSGVNMWNPCIYKRIGVPGSGAKQYWRADYDWIIVAGPKDPLPWADPLADAKPPKWKPGGMPTHRMPNGRRVNRTITRLRGGVKKEVQGYKAPELSNPGNIIDCGAVGGGNMGDEFGHENEAPFAEELAARFIRAFCPPGGTVLDPFVGSGTTLKMAYKHRRNAIGIDIRQSQIELTQRRLCAYHELMRPGVLKWHEPLSNYWQSWVDEKQPEGASDADS